MEGGDRILPSSDSSAGVDVVGLVGGSEPTSLFENWTSLVDQFDTRTLEVVGRTASPSKEHNLQSTRHSSWRRQDPHSNTERSGWRPPDVGKRRVTQSCPEFEAGLVSSSLRGRLEVAFPMQPPSSSRFGFSESSGCAIAAARSSQRGVAATVEFDTGVCLPQFVPLRTSFLTRTAPQGERSHAVNARGVGGFF